jgi:hypothetical protein
MPIVILKEGPLDGVIVVIDAGDREYRPRSAGLQAVNEETDETDPRTCLCIFAYRVPDPEKGKAEGQ